MTSSSDSTQNRDDADAAATKGAAVSKRSRMVGLAVVAAILIATLGLIPLPLALGLVVVAYLVLRIVPLSQVGSI